MKYFTIKKTFMAVDIAEKVISENDVKKIRKLIEKFIQMSGLYQKLPIVYVVLISVRRGGTDGDTMRNIIGVIDF